MKTEIKTLPQSQIELSVELSADELAPYQVAAARELSQLNPLDGFRPGLAPQDMVIKKLGTEKFERAVFDLAVKDKLTGIILEKKLDLIGEPRVSKVLPNLGGGLGFTATLSVVPQIDPGDYKKIKVPAEEVKLENKEIDDVMEDIRKSRAQNTNVSRPAQPGDRVEIDFLVKKDGEALDGGESKQHPFILGEGHFLAGFEDQLVGMKEGEAKNFLLAAPADYHQKDLAGQKLNFEVKMNLVQERKLPELNDDLAKALGQFSSLAELRNNVAEGLKAQQALKAKEKRRAKIVEELIKDIKADLPSELAQMELGKMTMELSESLARMNLTLENYLSHLGKTPEELKVSWVPQAEKRVKAALVLKAIATRENIQISDAEIEDRLNQIMRSAPPLAPGQNLDLTALRGYVKNVIRNEKVFELLEGN